MKKPKDFKAFCIREKHEGNKPGISIREFKYSSIKTSGIFTLLVADSNNIPIKGRITAYAFSHNEFYRKIIHIIMRTM